MSESIDTIKTDLWAKMREPTYREQFVTAHLSTNIAAQIKTIREQRGWSQRQLAEKAGMSPSRISVMENPSYDNYSLNTLKRVATAFDVALITRFIKFSDLVDWVADLSPEKLEVPNFEEDFLPKPTTEHQSPDRGPKIASSEPQRQDSGALFALTSTSVNSAASAVAYVSARPDFKQGPELGSWPISQRREDNRYLHFSR